MSSIDAMNIRDECRGNLVKYTFRALTCIPRIENPLILDAGCGTGVTSLAVLNEIGGTLVAVDMDQSAIRRFREKVSAAGLEDCITIIHDSILKPGLLDQKFDIVMAEGLLNVIGFEKGLPVLANYLKNDGFMILHDELKNDDEKRLIFRDRGLVLLDSFVLDEKVWWDEYYSCLERKIECIEDRKAFRDELEEIAAYRLYPLGNRSIYYVLRKHA